MSLKRLLGRLGLAVMGLATLMLGAALLGIYDPNPQVVYVPVTVVIASPPVILTPIATRFPRVAPASAPLDADILSTSATLFTTGLGQWVDFRVQFVASPFDDRTYRLAWCLDTDQNAATGDPCGPELGTEWGFTFRIGHDAPGGNDYFTGGARLGFNPCDSSEFDWYTNTLRVIYPLSVLNGDNSFNYAVAASTGANNTAPYHFDFTAPGNFFLSQVVDHPLPFDGIPLCAW